MIDISSLQIITEDGVRASQSNGGQGQPSETPRSAELAKQGQVPMLRRRSSVTLSAPIFAHIQTEEEKREEKEKELQDRKDRRDSQKKLSVMHKEVRALLSGCNERSESHRRFILPTLKRTQACVADEVGGEQLVTKTLLERTLQPKRIQASMNDRVEGARCFTIHCCSDITYENLRATR